MDLSRRGDHTRLDSNPKILILGAGPCGLGAAWRLKELGFEDFLVLEAGQVPGGLSQSFVDPHGFTWDIGGHIQFSHYEDFDRVMDLALPDGWFHHQRESWVWLDERFVPYPFQNNIHRLPPALFEECLAGLRARDISISKRPENFLEWMRQSFGAGISRIFMEPYNFKVWAYPPEMLDYSWIGERVATIDLNRIEENIRLQRDDVSWGPNALFRFPKKGGTGAIWKSVADLIGRSFFEFSSRLEKIDLGSRTAFIRKADGKNLIPYRYDYLFSTVPLDRLAALANLSLPRPLLSSNSHIVGIGLKGQTPESLKTKCWMYFPESNSPFYRVTVFSNYSPFNVPDAHSYWSLMAEVSESSMKPVREDTLVEEVIEGMRVSRLFDPKIISREEAASRIVSKWHFCARPGYPTPFLGRDKIIHPLLETLEGHQVFSRGRFGIWKYEVSNQDHTFMQGFEWADRILRGRAEETYRDPARINTERKRPAASL